MTRMSSRIGLIALAAVTVLYLVFPILVIIPMSFADSAYLTFPPEQFSTQWYERLFTDPVWVTSAINSLKVAVLTTICAVVLGTLAAMGMVRGRYPFRGAVSALLLAPLIVPYVIVGLSAYIIFLRLGLTETLLGFVLVHTALAVPYVIINVASGLMSYDRDLERAASSLGASPLTTFMHVTLPNILPSVLAGALFAFITSWDEVVTAIFISGPTLRTLPVQIWSGIRVQVDPTVAAVSGLTLFVIFASFAVYGLTKLCRNTIDKHRRRNAAAGIGADQ